MKRNEEGSLTIEATLTLTCFLFFVLFLMNFGRIYQAQNFMNHSMLQSAKNLSYLSFQYEKYAESGSDDYDAVTNFLHLITQGFRSAIRWNGDAILLESYYKSGNCADAARLAMQYCGARDKENWDKLCSAYYIQEIDLSDSEITDNDIVLKATYTIKLPFGFFGFDQVELNSEAKSAKWSK